MPILGVIPARLGSTRLVRKPLQLLGGEPLIVRVVERALSFDFFDRVVVATDGEAIRDAVAAAGYEVVLTRTTHPSGTDRVAEVADQPAFQGFEVIVNVQGDEPFLARGAVEGAVARVAGGDDVGTAAVPLDPEQAEDPSRVKVVCGAEGRALYFSRARIPFHREAVGSVPAYWQHLGLYAYTRTALARWVAALPSALERAEGLEQLRALELGLRVGVARVEDPSPPGVDTADDLRRAEAFWLATHEVVR